MTNSTVNSATEDIHDEACDAAWHAGHDVIHHELFVRDEFDLTIDGYAGDEQSDAEEQLQLYRDELDEDLAKSGACDVAESALRAEGGDWDAAYLAARRTISAYYERGAGPCVGVEAVNVMHAE
jgi:hypothetical protein